MKYCFFGIRLLAWPAVVICVYVAAICILCVFFSVPGWYSVVEQRRDAAFNSKLIEEVKRQRELRVPSAGIVRSSGRVP